jgi:phospholipid/cholesterol/gamma-HCH transport system permease protein
MDPNEQREPRIDLDIRSEAEQRASVRLRGCLDAATAARCWRELDKGLKRMRVKHLEVDVSELEIQGGIAVTLLRVLQQGGMTPDAEVVFRGLKPEQKKILDTLGGRDFSRVRPGPPPRAHVLEEWGASVRHLWEDLREQVAFTGKIVRILPGTLTHPKQLRWSEIRHILETAGANALPVIALFSGLVGLVLALEAAKPLEQFGAQLFIADMVGFSTVRDTGPLVTAIMLAGRSSSAFAAELGTMKVNQELDALTTMGLDPVRFLVVQRIIGTVLLTPLLTLYAMFMGFVGGITVLRFLGYPPLMIYHQIAGRVHLSDFGVGMVKSLLFGIIIGAVGCLRGLQTNQGPEAVGVSTTRSVVSCILLVVLANTLCSAITYTFSI